MRALTYFAAMAIVSAPAYWTYDLNRSVQHLQQDEADVPFFAYYRFGVVTESVVFNVSGAKCQDTLSQLLPTFEAFVLEMQDTPGITEVRLAWEGTTIAVMPYEALETRWDPNDTPQPIFQDPLATALGCSSDGALVVDWSRYKLDGSTLI